MHLIHKIVLGCAAVATLALATPAQAGDCRYHHWHHHCHHHHHCYWR